MDNNVSIGVLVYNEEKNIAHLLESLLNQKTKQVNIKEIFVVSSASTDKTDEIVRDFEKKDKRVKLIAQEKREGKAAAINLFLKHSKSEITVIESGDTIPHEECIENLCKPFIENKRIGFTGVRSIPTNDKKTFLGYIIHYWWWVSNELPRFGEMVAFRKSLAPEISVKTAVDEAYIEAIVASKGFLTIQIPEAIVDNHGSETIKDMIKQRKRIYIGHKMLKKEKGYSVQSFNFSRIGILTMKYIFKKEKSIKGFFYLFGGALIEIYSRIKGLYDIHIAKKNPFVWDIARSTKLVRN
jgi:cellulose synthase/poly-beta-1,6-N-acetylglucosamine synthase-like glycosyltransferase